MFSLQIFPIEFWSLYLNVTSQLSFSFENLSQHSLFTLIVYVLLRQHMFLYDSQFPLKLYCSFPFFRNSYRTASVCLLYLPLSSLYCKSSQQSSYDTSLLCLRCQCSCSELSSRLLRVSTGCRRLPQQCLCRTFRGPRTVALTILLGTILYSLTSTSLFFSNSTLDASNVLQMALRLCWSRYPPQRTFLMALQVKEITRVFFSAQDAFPDLVCFPAVCALYDNLPV